MKFAGDSYRECRDINLKTLKWDQRSRDFIQLKAGLSLSYTATCNAVCPPEVVHSDGHTTSERFLPQNN